jgi:hypothetical protein
MPALRNRRGVIAIFTVLLFLAMLTIIAVVVDFARMQFMRNQLQTASDAAALAGAVQLLRTPRSAYATQAETFGGDNPLLSTSVVVSDSNVVLGNWNPATRTFTGGASITTADAVQVTLHHPSSFIIANVLGWVPKQIAVRSVAWAGPSASQSNCMKPWALWFGLLRSRLDTAEGKPFDPSDTTSLTQEDLATLKGMTAQQRTFTLFLGNTANGSNLDPGNFYAVDLPAYYTAATNTYNTQIPGATQYSNTLQGVDSNGNPVCYQVGIGDTLATETGAMVGPTRQGVESPGVCDQVVGTLCEDANGLPPVIKSAFWTQATNKGSGKFLTYIKTIGSFTLTNWDQKGASITGVFQVDQDEGPSGPGGSTLVKVVLVK